MRDFYAPDSGRTTKAESLVGACDVPDFRSPVVMRLRKTYVRYLFVRNRRDDAFALSLADIHDGAV